MANIYYAYVDRPGEKPLRQGIIIYQKPKRTVGDAVIPEKSLIVFPNADGVFTVNDDGVDAKITHTGMKRAMERKNKGQKHPVLIGPVDNFNEILKQRYEQRPKTDAEQNAALKAKVAELEHKIEAGKSKKPEPTKKEE